MGTKKLLRNTHVVLHADCLASDEYFLEWEEMSEEAKKQFTICGPIPCEGNGNMGNWCLQCRFSQFEVED